MESLFARLIRICISGSYLNVQSALTGSQQSSWITPTLNDYQVFDSNVTGSLVGINIACNLTGGGTIIVQCFSGSHGRNGVFVGNFTQTSGRRKSAPSSILLQGSALLTSGSNYSLVFVISSGNGGSGTISIGSGLYNQGYFYDSASGSISQDAVFSLFMRLWSMIL